MLFCYSAFWALCSLCFKSPCGDPPSGGARLGAPDDIEAKLAKVGVDARLAMKGLERSHSSIEVIFACNACHFLLRKYVTLLLSDSAVVSFLFYLFE